MNKGKEAVKDEKRKRNEKEIKTTKRGTYLFPGGKQQ